MIIPRPNQNHIKDDLKSLRFEHFSDEKEQNVLDMLNVVNTSCSNTVDALLGTGDLQLKIWTALDTTQINRILNTCRDECVSRDPRLRFMDSATGLWTYDLFARQFWIQRSYYRGRKQQQQKAAHVRQMQLESGVMALRPQLQQQQPQQMPRTTVQQLQHGTTPSTPRATKAAIADGVAPAPTAAAATVKRGSNSRGGRGR